MKTFLLLMFCLLVIAHVTKSQQMTPEEEAEYKGHAQEDFAYFDTDKNGFIELPQMLALYQWDQDNFGAPHPTAEWIQNYCATFIASRDTDGDGKVNFDEYYHNLLREYGINI